MVEYSYLHNCTVFEARTDGTISFAGIMYRYRCTVFFFVCMCYRIIVSCVRAVDPTVIDLSDEICPHLPLRFRVYFGVSDFTEEIIELLSLKFAISMPR